YITIIKRLQNAVLQCKSYPGANYGSDHNPVVCKIRIKFKKSNVSWPQNV
ncbi:hypothetical protein HELRODRAFT_62298, partial [Helobdella robusta]|uniref:Endonuclease/exonuclease/phosphatase domain-containing protein n=1 Tax=Helobdella robusta TaxID=6412 RepID=T1FWZ1_HELRO